MYVEHAPKRKEANETSESSVFTATGLGSELNGSLSRANSFKVCPELLQKPPKSPKSINTESSVLNQVSNENTEPQISTMKRKLTQTTRTLDSLQLQLQESESTIESLNSTIKQQYSQISDFKSQLSNLEKTSRYELSQSNDKIAEMELKVQSLQTLVSSLKAGATQREQEFEATLKESNETHRIEIEEWNQKYSATKAELDDCRKQLLELQFSNVEFSSGKRSASMVAESRQLESMVQEMREKLYQLQEENEQLVQEKEYGNIVGDHEQTIIPQRSSSTVELLPHIAARTGDCDQLEREFLPYAELRAENRALLAYVTKTLESLNELYRN